MGVGDGAGVHDDGSGRRHSMIDAAAAATTTGLADHPPPPPTLGGCICGRGMERVSERRARKKGKWECEGERGYSAEMLVWNRYGTRVRGAERERKRQR